MAEYGREQRNQLSRAVANCESRSRQLKGFLDKRVVTNIPAESDTIQRILFTDIPSGNYQNVEDLGIWYGMSCEWNKQKTLPSSKPEDYIVPIQSLYDVSKTIPTIKKGDKVRVLAHGDTDGVTVVVNGGIRYSTKKMIGSTGDSIIEKIKTKTFGDLSPIENDDIIPIHCFMGNKKTHTGTDPAGGTLEQLGRSTNLGSGCVIIPPSGVKSIDAIGTWSGGKFIDSQGSWKKVSNVSSDLPQLNIYIKAPQGTSEMLKNALEEVFAKISTEYENFASACHLTSTGSDPNPWS